MKAFILITLALLCGGCLTQSEQVSLQEAPISRIGMGNDSHRANAKKLGIPYVDYLHMHNTGKVRATKSRIVHYHRFELR